MDSRDEGGVCVERKPVYNHRTAPNICKMVHNSDKSHGFATKVIHAGQSPDPSTGAVIPPISLSTTFKQSAVGVHQVTHHPI